MKRVAITLAILLILAICGVGFLYVDCAVTVTAMGANVTEAASQPELFQALALQVEQGAVTGTSFTDSTYLESAENYQLITYTIRLKNTCFVTADQVELQITPMDGDVLQVGDTTPKALSAHTTGDIQVTLLTAIGMHTAREMTLTYYMWGLPFTQKFSYSR